MYFVYILLSEKDKRTYVGYTKNVEARLQEHNYGRVTATQHRLLLKKFLVEEFSTAQEAKRKELWWKSSSGRRKLKEIFNRKNSVKNI